MSINVAEKSPLPRGLIKTDTVTHGKDHESKHSQRISQIDA